MEKKVSIMVGIITLFIIGYIVTVGFSRHPQKILPPTQENKTPITKTSPPPLSAEKNKPSVVDSAHPALSIFSTCENSSNIGTPSFGISIQPSNAVGVIATDPKGRTITPDTGFTTDREHLTEIPGVWYNSVVNINKNGRPIRFTSSPNLEKGVYHLQIVPDDQEPDKMLRFNLDVLLPNTCIRLANNATIAELPKEGYSLNFFDINLDAVVVRNASSRVKRYGFVSMQKNIDGKHQVIIAYVYPDSPAFRAGLEKDDMILSVNGKSVASMSFDQFDESIDNEDSITIIFTHSESNLQKSVSITKEIQK